MRTSLPHSETHFTLRDNMATETTTTTIIIQETLLSKVDRKQVSEALLGRLVEVMEVMDIMDMDIPISTQTGGTT
jgi:hypothetical protein